VARDGIEPPTAGPFQGRGQHHCATAQTQARQMVELACGSRSTIAAGLGPHSLQQLLDEGQSLFCTTILHLLATASANDKEQNSPFLRYLSRSAKSSSSFACTATDQTKLLPLAPVQVITLHRQDAAAFASIE